jgi:2-methylcitrate dehydratase
MAVAAYDGKVVPDNVIVEDRRKDPRIHKLSKHVNVIGDPEIEKIFQSYPTTGAPVPAIVEVHTKSGTKFVERVDYAKGSPKNPMTPNEIKQKFMDLATTVISIEHAKKIRRLISDLDRLTDITQLTDYLRFQ